MLGILLKGDWQQRQLAKVTIMNQGYSDNESVSSMESDPTGAFRGEAHSGQLASRLDRYLTYSAGLFLAIGMGCFLYIYAPQELLTWSAAPQKSKPRNSPLAPAASKDWYREVQFKLDSANQNMRTQMQNQQQLNNRLFKKN